ncbi:hypothetical protein VTN96DRAFT_8448 [Rasamsonia emersonii]|uniref:Uncharacterized protein n=1 Tax=Rasamsonia emersonii (strain ATCC 16479 / CBS 393.64 / IMI 116815) TaxID=1408163 RepID=A0A0F4Z309_RASE3|nr:hypothetical protein T310_1691 [Rasamsonia emersonii CBS 393.64]KKA24258.1 hypothetical protein T310_1691 [Rasamsonia emersonii CBS 393.64]
MPNQRVVCATGQFDKGEVFGASGSVLSSLLTRIYTEVWTGYVSKKLRGPANPGLDDHARLEKALFERTSTKMNRDTFEFGKEEGLSIAAEPATQREMLESLSARVSRLEAYEEDIIAVRSAVLDRFDGTESTAKRNSVVHGANVLADLEAIRRMSTVDPSRALRWREAFTTQYGVSYSDVEKHLVGSPREVIESLNMRMNVKSLHAWTRSRSVSVRQTKEKIEEACDAIIHEWLKSVLLGSPIRSVSPEMKASFQETELLYRGFSLKHRLDEDGI